MSTISSTTSSRSDFLPSLAATGDDSTQWRQYMNALLGVAPGGTLPGLQLVPTSSYIDLGNGNPQIANQALYKAADILPHWNLMYTPSAVSLFSQYGLFLNGIELTKKNMSADLKKRLANALSQLRADTKQLQKDINGNQPAVIISADQQQVDGDMQEVTETLEEIHGPAYMVFGQDLANYGFAQSGIAPNSNGNQLTMPTPSRTATPIQVPLYQIGSGFDTWLAVARSNAKSGINQLTLSFNQSSSTSYSGSFTSTSVSHQEAFFGWYSESHGSWQQVNVAGGSTLNYTVNISLPGVMLLGVQPGGWFDGTLIRDFQAGPFQTGCVLAPPAVLFGERGLFNLLSEQLLLAFAPRIDVQFDKDSWDTFYSAYSSSDCSGVSVGPFYARSSASSRQNFSGLANFDGTHYRMSFVDNSGLPQLLGVVANVLP